MTIDMNNEHWASCIQDIITEYHLADIEAEQFIELINDGDQLRLALEAMLHSDQEPVQSDQEPVQLEFDFGEPSRNTLATRAPEGFIEDWKKRK